MSLLSCSLILDSILLVLSLTTASEGAEKCYNKKFDCYEDSVECGIKDAYGGSKNISIKGITCKKWSGYKDDRYKNNPKNHCRNEQRKRPWCYTDDGYLLFRYCFRLCTETMMKVEIFDPAGMPSPLNYDGGMVVITCYNPQGKKRPLEIVTRNVSKGNPTVIRSNDTADQISYSTEINGSLSGQSYECKDGKRSIGSSTIDNVLCDPTQMPTKVCHNPREYCQRTTSGNDICSSINWHNCNSNRPHRFPITCPVTDSWSDLCTALNFLATPSVTSVSSSKSRCSPQHQFQLVTSDNHTQILMMSDFTSVDVDKLHSTIIMVQGLTNKTFTYRCKAMVNRTVIFDGSHEFSKNDGVWNMSNLKKVIINLSEPTNIYISCSGVDKDENENITAFSAQLVAFRSDALKVPLTERKRFITANEVIVQVNSRATAVDGLYVCLKAHKGICIPKEPRFEAAADSIITCGRYNTTCAATFYVGLFISSPKQMYMPIYNRTVSLTIDTKGITTQPETTHGASSMTKNDKTIAGMTSALIAMVIISVVSIVLAAVMGILWHKRGQMTTAESARRQSVDTVAGRRASTHRQSIDTAADRRGSTQRHSIDTAADRRASTQRRSSTKEKNTLGDSRTEFHTMNMTYMDPTTINRSQWQ